MESRVPYLAPELRPGWTFLSSQIKPEYLIDAERKVDAEIQTIRCLDKELDNTRDPEKQMTIMLAMKSANARLILAEAVKQAKFDQWQAEIGGAIMD